MNTISGDRGYVALKNHLIALTGLAFYADRDMVLTELIAARLADRGLRNCSVYSDFLAHNKEGGAELDILVAQLTIGETYFFRDESQFAAIRDIILPDILERKQLSRQLRIWSAGCATGAEPYSLAILLARELGARVAGWQVEIHASDLNQSYLTLAAKGAFRAWALRSLSEEVKGECFSKAGLVWTIHSEYKRWISFHQMNLIGDGFSPAPQGAPFDLILCRNVMIYFAAGVSQRLTEQFYGSLNDGGWLVVGAAEHNLTNYRAFRAVQAGGAKFYQKMTPQPLKELTRDISEVRCSTQVAVAEPLRPEETPAKPVSPDLEGLRRLADRGDWENAAQYAQRALTADRLNPAIHFYQALVLQNLGIAQESERSLRQAIYLDRNFALAHYHLGLALKRDGQMPAAARCFGNVLHVLAGISDQTMDGAGTGVTAAALRELAKLQLEESSAA